MLVPFLILKTGDLNEKLSECYNWSNNMLLKTHFRAAYLLLPAFKLFEVSRGSAWVNRSALVQSLLKTITVFLLISIIRVCLL